MVQWDPATEGPGPELLVRRPLTDAEVHDPRTPDHSQKVEACLRDLARICWLSHAGKRVCEIVALLSIKDATVRLSITRFND